MTCPTRALTYRPSRRRPAVCRPRPTPSPIGVFRHGANRRRQFDGIASPPRQPGPRIARRLAFRHRHRFKSRIHGRPWHSSADTAASGDDRIGDTACDGQNAIRHRSPAAVRTVATQDQRAAADLVQANRAAAIRILDRAAEGAGLVVIADGQREAARIGAAIDGATAEESAENRVGCIIDVENAGVADGEVAADRYVIVVGGSEHTIVDRGAAAVVVAALVTQREGAGAGLIQAAFGASRVSAGIGRVGNLAADHCRIVRCDVNHRSRGEERQ